MCVLNERNGKFDSNVRHYKKVCYLSVQYSIDLIKSKSKSFVPHTCANTTYALAHHFDWFIKVQIEGNGEKSQKRDERKLSQIYDQYPQNLRYKKLRQQIGIACFNDRRLEIQDLAELFLFSSKNSNEKTIVIVAAAAAANQALYSLRFRIQLDTFDKAMILVCFVVFWCVMSSKSQKSIRLIDERNARAVSHYTLGAMFYKNSRAAIWEKGAERLVSLLLRFDLKFCFASSICRIYSQALNSSTNYRI